MAVRTNSVRLQNPVVKLQCLPVELNQTVNILLDLLNGLDEVKVFVCFKLQSLVVNFHRVELVLCSLLQESNSTQNEFLFLVKYTLALFETGGGVVKHFFNQLDNTLACILHQVLEVGMFFLAFSHFLQSRQVVNQDHIARRLAPLDLLLLD